VTLLVFSFKTNPNSYWHPAPFPVRSERRHAGRIVRPWEPFIANCPVEPSTMPRPWLSGKP